ncbi:MAG: hypothetical protein M0000_05035 [Actinomycetota bacterium]|nr:hypothetical protein [Actinomycetota bacterium]MDA8208126.1 hypothetical protein [Actinomycetota bacterium]
MEYLTQIAADGGASGDHPAAATRRTAGGFEGEIEELGSIQVKPWIDPMVESLGFDPRSTYVEHFWLPILGPSCIFLLRRLAYRFDLEGEAQELSLKDMSCEIGLGSPKGFGNSITRTLNRCIQFDMARLLPNGVLTVRRSLPPLSQRQLARLPEELRLLHEQLLNGFAPDTGMGLRRRSVQLAVSMVDTQAGESEAVEALLRWKINAQVAAEALQLVWPR